MPTTLNKSGLFLNALIYENTFQLVSNGNYTVKVTGFGETVEEDDLRTFFGDAGRILECVIRQQSGERYAFISFENEEDAETVGTFTF